MAPKKGKSDQGKREVVERTIEVRKEIIVKQESGVRVSDLAAHFGMAKLTIFTIFKNKKMINAADVAKGVPVIVLSRDVQVGDVVTVGECRPLSKTVRFNVIKVAKSSKAKKAFRKF